MTIVKTIHQKDEIKTVFQPEDVEGVETKQYGILKKDLIRAIKQSAQKETLNLLKSNPKLLTEFIIDLSKEKENDWQVYRTILGRKISKITKGRLKKESYKPSKGNSRMTKLVNQPSPFRDCNLPYNPKDSWNVKLEKTISSNLPEKIKATMITFLIKNKHLLEIIRKHC